MMKIRLCMLRFYVVPHFVQLFLVMAKGDNNNAKFYPMLNFLKLTFSPILHFIFQTQT